MLIQLQSSIKKIFYLAFVMLFLIQCDNNSYTPKPKGYFRIQLPQKKYHKLIVDCPFTCEIPDYSQIDPSTAKDQPCWFNLDFKTLNATLYLSYKPIHNNLQKYLEDSRILAFKHTVKAVDIEQKIISYPNRKVYGLIYFIDGNTASSYQFHLTDSVHNFLRGSLYFNNVPNQDSIQPVLDFVEKDIQHLIKTLKWKN